ncbi:TPA: type 1 fimbrial protein [Enterobacter soli]|nr:type 1 fimbrial protein [Enterobacter soli]
MNMKKIAVALAMVSGISTGVAQAATTAPIDQGSGQIQFSGKIIDAPCSINTGDENNQTVDLGEVSKTALENGQTSTPKTFTIKLEQCDVSTSSLTSVSAKFTGAKDVNDPTMLGMTGDAKGAGIVLTDGAGAPINLGTESSPQTIQDGSNNMTFSAYLKSDGASAVVPGTFTSTADFTLAYK